MGSTTFNWVGGDGDWNTAAQWSGDVVPGAGQLATFSAGGAYTVTGDASIALIAVSGDFVTFDGAIIQDTTGSVELPSPSFIDIAGGGGVTVDSNALITGDGDISAELGTLLTVNGTLTDGNANVDAVVVDGIVANWSNGGTVTANQLYVQNGGSFAGALTLNDGGNVTLDTASTFSSGGTLNLAGNGTVYVADALGETNGSATLTDNIVLGAAGTGLTLGADPDVSLTVAGNITGDGVLYAEGGTITLDGTNSFTGGIVAVSGTLVVDGQAAAGTGAIFLSGASFVNGADTAGGSANLNIFTGDGENTISAGNGAITAFAGSAASTLTFIGGGVASTVYGGAGAVSATDGTGGGTFFGGSAGNDTLIGGNGNSTLVGGSAGDTLVATGAGAVSLVSSGGTTVLNGAGGSGALTFFTGASGTSLAQFGSGSDLLVGGGGTDVVAAGSGIGQIFTGAGATQLVFSDGSAGGTLAVLGFKLGTDTLHLQGYSDTEVQSALSGALVADGSTYLSLSDGTAIALFGVTGLTTDSFV